MTFLIFTAPAVVALRASIMKVDIPEDYFTTFDTSNENNDRWHNLIY